MYISRWLREPAPEGPNHRKRIIQRMLRLGGVRRRRATSRFLCISTYGVIGRAQAKPILKSSPQIDDTSQLVALLNPRRLSWAHLNHPLCHESTTIGPKDLRTGCP